MCSSVELGLTEVGAGTSTSRDVVKMAANLQPDLQKQNFGGGRSGRSSGDGELTSFPIIHQPWSQEAHGNDGLKLFPPSSALLGVNLQTKNDVGAGHSGGSDDERMPPISEPGYEEAHFKGKAPVTFLAPLAPTREEFQGDSQGTHQPIGDITGNTDHTITIPEHDDHFCRTCGPDEADTDDLLVILGCHCRGTLSRMHVKCILEWFGPRMCLQNDYRCELCNAVVNGRIEFIVILAMFGPDSVLTDILMKALQNTDDPNFQNNDEIARQAQRPQRQTAGYNAPNRLQPDIIGHAPNQLPSCRNTLVNVCVILGLVLPLILGLYIFLIFHDE